MLQTAKNTQSIRLNLQEESLINFRKELENTGCTQISKKYLPWNAQELNYIENITSPAVLPYKRSEYGDTGEQNPVSYFRILHPTNHETELPECMALINNNSAKTFFSGITGMDPYDIDRCQVHMYSQGDFIALHTDSDSCPEYIYSSMLLLSDDYEGGEFVMHTPERFIVLKPKKYSMIVVNSNYFHEVKKVVSGIRRSLVFFIKA